MSNAARPPRPPPTSVATTILSDDALAFVAELHGRFGAAPRRAAGRARARERERARPASCRRPGDPRGRLAGPAAARRLRRPPRRDHRPDRPQAGHQRAQLGRQGLHGRLRGRELADLAQPGRGPRQPDRRDRGHDHLRRLRRQALRARSTTPRRCSCARAAGTCPRSTCTIDGEPVAGALVDFGLYAFHNGPRLAERGSRPLPLPAEDGAPPRGAAVERRLHLRRGRARRAAGPIRATVLIETLPAAFQMDEILYELREHSYGLNAGRWDYIFSMIKCFRDDPDVRAPGPQRRDDDRPVHARLHGAAGQDLPRAAARSRWAAWPR